MSRLMSSTVFGKPYFRNWFEIVHTYHVSSPVTKFANSFWLSFGNFSSNSSAICTRTPFVSVPIDGVSIWQNFFMYILDKLFGKADRA